MAAGFKPKVGRLPRVAVRYGGSAGKHNMKSAGLGNDPIKLMKRFFLYRNMFGNEGGAPELDPMGNPGGKMPLAGNPMRPGAGVGNINALSSGRRMGLI